MTQTNEPPYDTFETWYDKNEDELSIGAAESGCDREYGYCPAEYADRQYDIYVREQERKIASTKKHT